MIAYFAKRIFKKYRPRIIFIQEGDSVLMRACFFILKQKFKVRFSECEVKYAFLLSKEPRSLVSCLLALFSGVRLLLLSSHDYPEIMIIDGRSDVRQMPFRPSDAHAYVTVRWFFHKRGERIFPNAFYIVNGDDHGYREDDGVKNKVRVMTYGITNPRVRVKGEDARTLKKDGRSGLYMKLLYEGTATPLFIPYCSINDAAIALAGAALGIALSLTPLEIARGLEEFGRGFLRERAV